MPKKILVIQHNTDGRPCAWGLVPTSNPEAEKLAKEEAERQWKKHSCYPGEEKGELAIHVLDKE
jgi:hypothetical protein